MQQYAKWIYLGQRNPRLTKEEFSARWLSHRRIGTKPEMVAEFIGATYGAVRLKSPDHDYLSDEYDAIGLFALEGLHSIPTIARILKSDYIQADERRFFISTSDTFSIFCQENVIRNGPETEAVAVQFLRRPDGATPNDFMKGWEEQGAGILERSSFAGKVARYVRNVVCAPPPPGFGYDGVAELWFDSAESMAAAAPEMNAIMVEAAFIDPANSLWVMTDVVMSRQRKDLAG